MTARRMLSRLSLAAFAIFAPWGWTAPSSVFADEVRKVDYAKDVAAILQAKCQNCHRPNQAAPFSLLTYEQAKRWSSSIAEVVEEGRMPPWHAAPGHLEFANDRSLSPDQKATLSAWVRQGCPPGDLTQAPPAREFSSDWKIGTPDVVLAMPKPFAVKAEGTIPYQWVRIPTNFTEDKWIQAAEVRPGDRRVLHHILVFVDSDGGLRPRDGLDTKAQLCGYAPGDVPSIFPAGTAKKIPAGSVLWLQIHYTPVGKATTDQSSIGLVFAKNEDVKAQVGTHGIFQTQFLIPPKAANHPVEKTFTVPTDVKLLALWPHMHLRGKDFKFTAIYPDGRSEVLLDVPRYDFSWQTTYNLKQPKPLPKGTKIHCVAHFDNSSDNPANPAPERAVHWGDQTDDEMMIGYLDYTIDGPNALKLEPLRRTAARAAINGNGEANGNAGANPNARRAVGEGIARFLRNRRQARQAQDSAQTQATRPPSSSDK